MDHPELQAAPVKQRENQQAVVIKDFTCIFRARIGLEHGSVGGVNLTDRGVIAQRRVNPIADSHHAAVQIDRKTARTLLVPGGAPAALLPAPLFHPDLPQRNAVEGVTRGQVPPVGHIIVTRQVDRRLIEEVKDASACRDKSAQARIIIVRPRPHRFGQPLVDLGWSRHQVFGNGIAVGRMQMMRPLVDISGPGLGVGHPDARVLEIGRAARRQHAHHLRGRHTAEVFGYQQVDQVFRVGQVFAVKPIDRYKTVFAHGGNVVPGLRHALGIDGKPVNCVAAVRAEPGTEFGPFRQIAAVIEVDDDSAMGAAAAEDLPGFGKKDHDGYRGRVGESGRVLNRVREAVGAHPSVGRRVGHAGIALVYRHRTVIRWRSCGDDQGVLVGMDIVGQHVDKNGRVPVGFGPVTVRCGTEQGAYTVVVNLGKFCIGQRFIKQPHVVHPAVEPLLGRVINRCELGQRSARRPFHRSVIRTAAGLGMAGNQSGVGGFPEGNDGGLCLI